MRWVLSLAVACVSCVSSCALDTDGLGAGSDDGGGATGGGSAATGGSAGGDAASDAGAGTGGSAGAAAFGGAAGAGGSAGATGTESCLDGVDNDADGLVDCADPECSPGHQCVPQAPSGYIGYARTRGDVFNAPPGPACADGSAPVRYSTSPAGAHSCSPCECGPLSGAGCGDAPLLCSTSATTCDGTIVDLTASAKDGQCHNGSASVDTLSCKLGSIPVLDGGGCATTGGEVAAADPFDGVTDACRFQGAPGAGCANGEVCIPRGAGDYAGYVCVEQIGDQPCPNGWGAKIVGYTGASDTRSCTGCACTPGGVQCVGAEYTLWDGIWCSLGSTTVDSNQCKNLSGLTDLDSWAYERTKLPSATGSCAASGGQPTGAVYPTGALTFCCKN